LVVSWRMQVVRSIQDVVRQKNSVVTVGTFDGVHRGHQQIVSRVLEKARLRRARSVVVTFEPHPREIVGRGPAKLLTTIDERIALLETTGIDLLVVHRFTFEFSRLSSSEFCEEFIVKRIGVGEVVVGYDHMFGRDREGGWQELKEMGQQFGFAVHREPPLVVDGEIVGSSKIREALLRGDVDHAQHWLGRPYCLSGLVVPGDGRGARLGFPTANLQPSDERKLVPAEGVYFVTAELDGKHLYGMLNVGVRPTFKDDHRTVIEVHLFRFEGTVYGKKIVVRFVRRLRAEQKFPSSDDLTRQLQQDREQCLKLIEENQNSMRGE